MTRETFLQRVQALFDIGKISAEAYDTLQLTVDEFAAVEEYIHDPEEALIQAVADKRAAWGALDEKTLAAFAAIKGHGWKGAKAREERKVYYDMVAQTAAAFDEYVKATKTLRDFRRTAPGDYGTPLSGDDQDEAPEEEA